MNRDTLNMLQNIIPTELQGTLMDIISTPSTQPQQIRTTLTRSATRITVYAEMPGFDEDGVEVDFFNNKMNVCGVKHKPVLLDGENSVHSNIKYGRFSCSVNLPVSVTNQENVNTIYENGVLTVIINLAQEEKNRFKINLGEQRNRRETSGV